MAIEGGVKVLFIDATDNLAGWEHSYSRAMYDSLKRRRITLVGTGPHFLGKLDELPSIIRSEDDINCIFLQANVEAVGGRAKECWESLNQTESLKNRLFAVAMCNGFDKSLSDEILNHKSGCSITICPVDELSKRQSSAFFVKLLIELDLHCSESISSFMARFAFAKAKRFAPDLIQINS
jgi:hypothetical protein